MICTFTDEKNIIKVTINSILDPILQFHNNYSVTFMISIFTDEKNIIMVTSHSIVDPTQPNSPTS